MANLQAEDMEAETAFLSRALGLRPRMRRSAQLPRVMFRACPRCHGDLMREPEDWHSSKGDDEFACLQCGRRIQVDEIEGLKATAVA